MVKNVATYIIASYMLWWLKLGMLGSCSGHFCLAEGDLFAKAKAQRAKNAELWQLDWGWPDSSGKNFELYKSR